MCICREVCDVLEATSDDEKTLVFRGSFIKEVVISPSTSLMQYSVDEIYRGDVVTPLSPYYETGAFVNTMEAVWLVSGISVSCDRTLDHSDGIFIVSYQGATQGHSLIGYRPTICRQDRFYIAQNHIVKGVYPYEDFVMVLWEFEDLLRYGCYSEASDTKQDLILTPNPVTDIVDLQLVLPEDNWSFILFDCTGRELLLFQETSINLQNLATGVYFIVATNGKKRRSKRLVKL